MRFFLFILLNAALFIRPAELTPSLEFPLYSYIMYLCMAVSSASYFRTLPGVGRNSDFRMRIRPVRRWRGLAPITR